jgi:DNA polymerase III sliding clamp (beta) subunit (PCNA family)
LPDRTRFVATNRYILSMYERTDVVFPKPEGGVVPTRVLQAFDAGIEGLSAGDDVLIYVSDGHILLVYKGFSLFSKCLEVDFPDYERAIPKEPKYIPILNREALINAIKQILPFANKTTPRIDLSFDEANVVVSTENTEQKISKAENLSCKYSGDAPTGFRISFNAKSLLPILENIKSEHIVMKMVSSWRNVIILPEPQDSKAFVLYGIAPMLVLA